jgi:putative drug exporter of the RND superfamily
MTSRQAYDMLAAGFGPGFNGPLQLVAELRSPGDAAALGRLAGAVRATRAVAAVPSRPVPAPPSRPCRSTRPPPPIRRRPAA